MEPGIEDISSEKIQATIRRLEVLEKRISWARALTLIGGLACCFWVLYRVFATRGLLLAFLAFIALSVVYKFGISPLFAVSASVLSFYLNAVGVWLPVTSYVLAAILLYVDLKRDSLRRRVDPYNLGSIHD